MKLFRFIVALVLSVSLIFFLNKPNGNLPALAPLLSPFTGFWQNNESSAIPSNQIISISGTHRPVTILMDDHLVPHIFAQNDYDLYYAQGYITAKYRLWQMEFETAAAAGRISEIIGAKALDYDRYQRRFGMIYGAEQSLKDMQTDSNLKEAVDAYTAGINEYINRLKPSQYPIEYKLLDYQPEAWTPLKCALLLMFMRYDLSARSDDLKLTNILQQYGSDAINQLFPDYDPFTVPIIPRGTVWNFQPVKIPPVPNDSVAASFQYIPPTEPDPDNGSNNWAVNGSKTQTGYPVLCNDPHLGLNLPSLWFQLQMVSPGENIYGVSLPGVPAIIIGFNQHIAWGVTNVGSDVTDWYLLKFRDRTMNEYRYDSSWRKTTKRIETIHVRGAKDVNDTVIYSHYGPVVATNNQMIFNEDVPEGCSLKWIGLEGGKELKTFMLLNSAKNYADYVQALSFYSCPAQNFVYADDSNNIAMWVNGRFPVKWKGQGKYILDGSDSAMEWHGYIPHEQVPHVKNPPQNYLCSANQLSADSTYPYYLNWDFDVLTRAQRINERLSSMQNINADSMRALQMDDENLYARYVLPALLPRLNMQMNDEERTAFDSLSKWNLHDDATSIGAAIFSTWWQYLKDGIWKDDFGNKNLLMQYPHSDITMKMILYDTSSKWIDNRNTAEKETLTDIAQQSFKRAIDSLQKEFGPVSKSWQWANVKDTRITHLLQLPAFSKRVSTSGDRGIVNATADDHGPSWRMIVELGPQLKAFGIYPGGQSGNPGNKFYDNMIDPWSKGELDTLLYLSNEHETSPHIISTITIKKP